MPSLCDEARHPSNPLGSGVTITRFDSVTRPEGWGGFRNGLAELAPEQKFGTYRIVRRLGRGGMGVVYEADHLPTSRRVALKVMGHSLDDRDARARFLREGRLAASINHPNSVYVYGTEEIDGRPAISMELVRGGTLGQRVKVKGALAPKAAVDAILQIIDGLDAAYQAGVGDQTMDRRIAKSPTRTRSVPRRRPDRRHDDLAVVHPAFGRAHNDRLQTPRGHDAASRRIASRYERANESD
ncbi:protein kinase domain-containing protein [Novipirellula artificiosorum]|uniref:protein kinase domain-containing protein n=1 Tax=Novipirellula artificiosorum TaxID=2528016 RepID=UPI001E2B2805|nr:protein kinase [Novipirellula artificiosorum]